MDKSEYSSVRVRPFHGWKDMLGRLQEDSMEDGVHKLRRHNCTDRENESELQVRESKSDNNIPSTYKDNVA